MTSHLSICLFVYGGVALDELSQFEKIDESIHVKQFISDSKDYMIQVSKIHSLNVCVQDKVDKIFFFLGGKQLSDVLIQSTFFF